MQDITERMLDRLVDAVTTAERSGVYAHLPARTPAATRDALVRRELVHRNKATGLWELSLEAIGMAEDEIEWRVHDANEEAARPAMQAAADRAFVAQNEDLAAPDVSTVWNGARGYHLAPADHPANRPLCGSPYVFARLDGEVGCRRCVKALAAMEAHYALVVAARERVAALAATS